MRTQILKDNPADLALAVAALRAGELVSFPTETVYGLGAVFDQPAAVAKIFAAKERPKFDPLIVHIQTSTNMNQSSRTAIAYLLELNLIQPRELSELAQKRVNILAEKFWPGPLTLVLPRSDRVSDLVTSGLPSVAIRMPAHPVAQKLLNMINTPLVGPSANRFGRISPTTANDVLMELENRIPFILDGGRAQVGIESTVLFLENDGVVRVLRPGGLSQEVIESAIGAKLLGREGLSPSSAPGMLKNHYAPKKPLILLPASVLEMTEANWVSVLKRLALQEADAGSFATLGFLAFSGDIKEKTARLSQKLSRGIPISKILSVGGNLEEAAHLLFGSLRVLDLSPADCILAEPCATNEGLGWAIQDRLLKASAATL